MAEYIDTSINPADYIEVWEVEDAEHGKQLVMAVDDLQCLPPADVRPVVRGRWRKIGNNSDGTSDYECSACLGIMMHVPDDDEHPMVSFCSMCGADMRENE